MFTSFPHLKSSITPAFIRITTTFIAVAGITATAEPCKSLSCLEQSPSFYGTLEPFASESIYFLLLDRFVDGDPSNNHEDQGGDFPTWDQKLIGPNGEEANVGYLGGDFQGVIKNLDYIRDMGFTAIWTTPVMDNPDQNFSGGEPITFAGAFKDGGKTGYHGYWMDNFFVEDEHYVSAGLDFEAYASALHAKGLKVVFDIVANHGSPSFTMPVDQPKFGELYDADWNLVADHQNLAPKDLDPANPLHAFYHNFEDFMQLSNIDESNPAVVKYFVDAYRSWIEKGADAIRIDTIRHVPHSFWKTFTDQIRSTYPGYFMFGESYVYDANFIAQHTLPKNGGVSVLDFPGREAIVKVFEKPENGYDSLESYLHLTHGPYTNPYELVTFYDNHDMARIQTTTQGYIDAHNWLFTARGIPCIYYGSELAFMTGKAEHQGNRNYLGQENIEIAKTHPIRRELARIAGIRKQLVSLQRGLQVNLSLKGDQASFLRVYQHQGTTQTALVLLNKSDTAATITASEFIQAGKWTDTESGVIQQLKTGDSLTAEIQPHSFSIWVNEDPIRNARLIDKLQDGMTHK